MHLNSHFGKTLMFTSNIALVEGYKSTTRTILLVLVTDKDTRMAVQVREHFVKSPHPTIHPYGVPTFDTYVAATFLTLLMSRRTADMWVLISA